MHAIIALGRTRCISDKKLIPLNGQNTTLKSKQLASEAKTCIITTVPPVLVLNRQGRNFMLVSLMEGKSSDPHETCFVHKVITKLYHYIVKVCGLVFC